MNKKRWFEKDTSKNGPITLWDMSTRNDCVDAMLVDETLRNDGWRISDDSVISGNSYAKFIVIRNLNEYKNSHQLFQATKTNGMDEAEDSSNNKQAFKTLDDIDQIIEEEKKEAERLSVQEEGVKEYYNEEGESIIDDQHKSSDKCIPFVRWKGQINTQVNEEQEKQGIKRTGFCAIKSPDYPFGGANLDGRYNALEIMCRSDGRPYSVNLRVESFIPDDVYQCFINIPPTSSSRNHDVELPGKFDKVILLFRDFMITSKGRLKATQRELDNAIKIESIGFTLMDGCDGPFEFDLARIRAVNFDETGVIGTPD